MLPVSLTIKHNALKFLFTIKLLQKVTTGFKCSVCETEADFMFSGKILDCCGSEAQPTSRH